MFSHEVLSNVIYGPTIPVEHLYNGHLGDGTKVVIVERWLL